MKTDIMLNKIIATSTNIRITVSKKRWKKQITVMMMETIMSSRTMSTVMVFHFRTKMETTIISMIKFTVNMIILATSYK